MLLNFSLNFLFSIFCLILLNIIGHFVSYILKINQKMNRIVIGFLTIAFLNFLVAFPSQIFHWSWNSYYLIFSFLLLLLVGFSIYTVIKNKLLDKINLQAHMKRYWFLYVLVLLHAGISLSGNMHVYIAAHGDDSYYLARILKSIGSPALQENNAFVAQELLNVADTFMRQFETFEMLYAYIADTFNLSIVYTVRFLLPPTIISIIYLTYYSLAQYIVPSIDKHKYQYFLLPLFFFALIGVVYVPKGGNPFFISYLENGGANYEAWKWNFTLYYGSTIVMMMGAPLYLMTYFETLIRKIQYQKFYIYSIILTIILISFSLQAVVIASALFIGVFCFRLCHKITKKELLFYLINTVGIISIITIIYFMQANITSLAAIFTQLINDWNNVTFPSIIKQITQNGLFFALLIGWVIVLIGIVKSKKIQIDFFLWIALFCYGLLLFPLTGMFVQWLGVYTYIFGRMYNTFVILLSFITIVYLLKLRINQKMITAGAILLLSIAVILVPLSREKMAQEYVTGYGVSIKALKNYEKIHPVVTSINTAIINDMEVSEVEHKPYVFIPTAVVAKNQRTLLLSYHEQFLIPNQFIEYNSLLLTEHFEGTLPPEYNSESPYDEFRQNLMNSTIILPNQLIETMKTDYQLDYFVTYGNKLENDDVASVVAEISDADLDYSLYVYKIKK